jgi:predicted DNA-binding protein
MKTTLRLAKPTPIRLHRDSQARLRAISKKFRLRPAELIRLAIDAKLPSWEAGEPIIIRNR